MATARSTLSKYSREGKAHAAVQVAAQTTDGNSGSPGLFIVGVNIDAKRAWWHKHEGNLERVTDGVYVNNHLKVEQKQQLLTAHALRLAKFARPDAVLSGASAYHRSTVGNALSLVSEFGARVKRLKPGFDMFTFRAPWLLDAGAAAFQQITVKDSLGEFQLRCFSSEMLLLDAFSTTVNRLPHTMLNPRDLADLTDAVLAKHGDVDSALERIKKIADRIDFHRQFRRLQEHMQRAAAYQQTKRSLYEYVVLWNQYAVANLAFDGAFWTMEYERTCKLPLTLSSQHARDQVPSFIASLLPERTLRGREAVEDGFREFQIADRYASNITIRALDRAMQKVIIDCLDGDLRDFAAPDLVFTGTPDETLTQIIRSDEALNRLERHRKTPRTSGVQLKVPCHLSSDGILSVAHDKAFTHIVKLSPQSADMSSLGSVEWFTMHLAAQCGIITEKFVVADLGGNSPALIAERFDIRQHANDDAMILAEDMWSIMGLTRNDEKYDADLAEVGRIVREHSTEPDVDAARLLRQVVFSWVAGNSDLHLKNMMMIKHANDEMNGFKSVRFSPAYDLGCTMVYPGQAETAALRIDNRGHYTLDLLRSFADKIKISKDQCDEIVSDVVAQLGEWLAPTLEHLPEVIRRHETSVEHLNKAATIMASRAMALAAQLRDNKSLVNRVRIRPGGGAQDDSMTFSA